MMCSAGIIAHFFSNSCKLTSSDEMENITQYLVKLFCTDKIIPVQTLSSFDSSIQIFLHPTRNGFSFVFIVMNCIRQYNRQFLPTSKTCRTFQIFEEYFLIMKFTFHNKKGMILWTWSSETPAYAETLTCLPSESRKEKICAITNEPLQGMQC